jgi:hypothetical protein
MFRNFTKRDAIGWGIIGVAMFANAFFWVWMGNRMDERFVNGPMFVHEISPECKTTGGCRFEYAENH